MAKTTAKSTVRNPEQGTQDTQDAAQSNDSTEGQGDAQGAGPAQQEGTTQDSAALLTDEPMPDAGLDDNGDGEVDPSVGDLHDMSNDPSPDEWDQRVRSMSPDERYEKAWEASQFLAAVQRVHTQDEAEEGAKLPPGYVRAQVPRGFVYTGRGHIETEYRQGEHAMPREHADNDWARGVGVVIVDEGDGTFAEEPQMTRGVWGALGAPGTSAMSQAETDALRDQQLSENTGQNNPADVRSNIAPTAAGRDDLAQTSLPPVNHSGEPGVATLAAERERDLERDKVHQGKPVAARNDPGTVK